MPALSERDMRVLAFERGTWRTAGAKEQAIAEVLGITATRYYQLLNELIDRPEALKFDPTLVKRLRAQRARRQRVRSGWLPSTPVDRTATVTPLPSPGAARQAAGAPRAGSHHSAALTVRPKGASSRALAGSAEPAAAAAATASAAAAAIPVRSGRETCITPSLQVGPGRIWANGAVEWGGMGKSVPYSAMRSPCDGTQVSLIIG